MPGGGAQLRRVDRLRRPREFQRVAREGRRVSSPCFVLLAAGREEPGGGAPRLGITVGRRVGAAVARNRLKRRVREWFRRQSGKLGAGVDLVVIARSGAPGLGTEELERELCRLLRRAAVGRCP